MTTQIIATTLFIFALLQAFGAVEISKTNHTVMETLRVDNGLSWGDWHDLEVCPDGSFAAGFNLKVESPRGPGDDTSVNAICIRCFNFASGNYTGEVCSGQGPWGNYKGEKLCEQKEKGAIRNFLVSYSLRVEPPRGIFEDDTGVNNVMFGCRSANGLNVTSIIVGEGNRWGKFGEMTSVCELGSAVCGVQTRLEKFKGAFEDDAAITDADFACCKFPSF